MRAGDHVCGDEADQNHRGADEGVEHQLHRAVLAPCGAPDSDQEILGDDDDLVEDEEKEQVVAEKYAVDGANQQQVEGKEFLSAMFDVPGKENAGNGDDAGEQNEAKADAVRGKVIMDAEGGNPWHVGDGQHLSGAVVHEGRQPDGESGDRCEQREDARRDHTAFGQQEHRGSTEKRDVDRPSKHNFRAPLQKDLPIRT